MGTIEYTDYHAHRQCPSPIIYYPSLNTADATEE
jgi:hypothetical protein